MANYDVAWAITSENEGPYSNESYDMPTNWGVTLPFCRDWKFPVTTVAQLKSLSRAQCGAFVKQIIHAKVLNGYLGNQHLLNMLLDAGFNKPAYTIKWFGRCIGRTIQEINQAVDAFRIPKSWFLAIRNVEQFYADFWRAWWDWSISSGHFKQAAPGLARRIWRFHQYGSIVPYDNNGAYYAWKATSNGVVKTHLHNYLLKHPFDSKKEGKRSMPTPNSPAKRIQKRGSRGGNAFFGFLGAGTILYLCFKK